MNENIYFTFDELLEKWNVDKKQIFDFIASGELHPTFIVNEISSIKAFISHKNGEFDGELELTPFDNEYEALIDNDGLGRHFLIEPKFKTSKLVYFELSTQNISANKSKNVIFKHFENLQGARVSKFFDLDFIEKNTEFSAVNVEEFESNNHIPSKPKKTDGSSQQQRKINNLLRLFYSLANLIDDFDPSKPTISARVILEEAHLPFDISPGTLESYIKEAYKLEQSKNNIT